MIERPFRFEGAEAGLLALPANAANASRTGVVWLNAGAIRRAGPFRLHAVAARHFAALGFPTLRVDQPGNGDHLPAARRPQREIATALLDELQRETGCERFVVGGICSAADDAWQWALEDARIAGLLLLDPLARRSAPGFRRGQLQLLWRRGPSGWLALLARRLARRPKAARVSDDQLRDWSSPGSEAGELARLVERGVECFVLYTGGAAAYFTHPRQFFAGFGVASRSPRVRFGYWREADHLFYRPDDRERLVRALGDWLVERWAPAPHHAKDKDA